jgi:hypothetical protein
MDKIIMKALHESEKVTPMQVSTGMVGGSNFVMTPYEALLSQLNFKKNFTEKHYNSIVELDKPREAKAELIKKFLA